MTTQFKGTSELALMAERLPPRGRDGLALIAAEFALQHLEPLPAFPVAKAFDLAKRSFDGEPVDPDSFEDAFHDERHQGVGICAMHAKSEPEISAWVVLGTALLYIAFHLYRTLGQVPTPTVSHIEEAELDSIDKHLRVISPASFKTLLNAVDVLERNQGLSFAQLKAAVSRD